MSPFTKGHETSVETRQRISATKRSQCRHSSDEHKRKISEALLGSKCYLWKGGKKRQAGYTLIYKPEHPSAKNRYVFEHRLVMEQHLGRYLIKSEVVHHINHNKSDNSIENLMLYTKNSDHVSYHFKGKLKRNVKLVDILEMREKCFTLNQIAQHFKVSLSTIKDRLKPNK